MPWMAELLDECKYDLFIKTLLQDHTVTWFLTSYQNQTPVAGALSECAV